MHHCESSPLCTKQRTSGVLRSWLARGFGTSGLTRGKLSQLSRTCSLLKIKCHGGCNARLIKKYCVNIKVQIQIGCVKCIATHF